MIIALVGLVFAIALIGRGLERHDEAHLRVMRQAKLLELGGA